jgi:hypothetical protein
MLKKTSSLPLQQVTVKTDKLVADKRQNTKRYAEEAIRS